MDELMDLLVTDDSSSSQISDKIKDILFQKSATNIEAIRPHVATSLFDDSVDFDTVGNSEVESDVDFDQE
jgi:hypothetical protein